MKINRKRVSGENPSSSQIAFTTNLCSKIPEEKHCMENHFHIRESISNALEVIVLSPLIQ